MKKIILGVAILVILIGGYFVYQNSNQSQSQVKVSPGYYQNLKDNCATNNFKECCLDSVKTMEVTGGYKFGDFMIDGCADGYEMMRLRCPGAYILCNPADDFKNRDSLPVPQEIPATKPAPDFVPTEFNQIKLPDNVITEKDCALKGGEVWNTLGETTYNGELIGKIEGLKCPCACLVRSEGSDKIWVNVDGKLQEFTGSLDDIQTFDDCKKAGFKVTNNTPEICTVGEPHMTGGKYKTFSNNQMETGKTCADYHYSTCPGSCVAKCVSSSCGEPDGNGAVACTSDCDGQNSCTEKTFSANTEEECAPNFPDPFALCGSIEAVIAKKFDKNGCVTEYGCK